MANAKPVSIVDLRNNFLSVARPRSQKMPGQAYADGGVLTFDLPKAGFGRYILLSFKGSLSITGTGGSIALSPKAPFNLFSKVAFEDYLGVTRISASGWKLYERDSVVSHAPFDPASSLISESYSSQLVENSIGGGTGAAGTYPWQFNVMVPISLHDGTTEGSFPFTVPKGQNTLTINLNTLVGSGNDNVIKQTTAGFTCTLTGTVNATFYYWDVPSGTPLPLDDFALVHEIREIKTTDNISAGSEKRFTLPTGRTYFHIIQDLTLNDAMDTMDVDNVSFYVDGNTPYMDEDLLPYLYRTRRDYKRDFPVGMFYFDFWGNPWTPQNYGSLETSLEIASGATTSGNTYSSILLESLYRTNDITA